MASYMIQAAYTAEAMAAFASNPQDRVAGIKALLERLGAKLEGIDFCLGDYDVVLTCTAPDATTAAAISLAAQAPGHLKAFKTTTLLSPDEFMAAQRMASGVSYRGPARG
jgi:uncharacterized protein with GYD domain